MNYAKALASSSRNKNNAMDIIQKQAKLEIGRELSKTEENQLLKKYSIYLLSEHIEKV